MLLPIELHCIGLISLNKYDDNELFSFTGQNKMTMMMIMMHKKGNKRDY